MEVISERENKIAETINELFHNSSFIRIPPYQRAYSWEEKQCSQFIEDLQEQKGKKYYLGQFLFEREGDTLYIIDGQQRLTTTIIFMSALCKIIDDVDQKEELKQVFLNDVFKTIDDDQVIFKKVTRKHLISVNEDAETTSQRRILDAYNLFLDNLKQISEKELLNIKNTLQRAVISTFYITNKVEATQIFEYQNNRGKELSRFEIIKAYLMHQVYLNCPDEKNANNAIIEIQSSISKTYRYLEAVEGYFTENILLDNFCNLFYNIDGNIDAIKSHLKVQNDKVEWIKDFFENFTEISFSAKNIVRRKDKIEISNLFFLGNEANWKIVLMALFHKGDDQGEYYDKILKLLEILCFKLKLGDYRSDYLPGYAKEYYKSSSNYHLENLYEDIKSSAINGFLWYWNENDRFKNIIDDYFTSEKSHYHRTGRIKFVLWQYENYLRIKNRSGALMDKKVYDNYTIEHIKPQKPKNGIYSDDFKKNYLQLAGNLALLTQSQNSKFGNKSFEEKKELFQDTALSSYTEIRAKEVWGKDEIRERHERISTFVKDYFDTSNL